MITYADVNRLLLRIKGLFPRRVPTGMTEFNNFYAELTYAYRLPRGSTYRHAVATMIMHLDSGRDRVRPVQVARAIRKAQANQIAFAVIEQIRREDKHENGVIE